MRGEEPEGFPQITPASLGLVPDCLKRQAIVGLARILRLKLYGPEFIRPALEDRSKKVRNWARKQLKEV